MVVQPSGVGRGVSSARALPIAGRAATTIIWPGCRPLVRESRSAKPVGTPDIWPLREPIALPVEALGHDTYFHRIALADRELSVDNLGRALQFLGECPEDLHGWEWHYLMRFCRVDPLVLRDKTEVNSLAFSPDGEFLGMHTFGESGPAKDVYEHFGITAPRAAELGRRVLDAAGARAAG